MKPIAWMLGGFALMGLAAALESLSDLGSNPVASLPLSLPSIFILLGGQYCLWRGFRSGVALLWSGAFDRRKQAAVSEKPRSAHSTPDNEPIDGFDADAAFARYMERREADQSHPTEMPNATIISPPERATFGRRAV